MTTPNPILLMGVPGSPYTRKMLALLRYRRIPYRLVLGSQRTQGKLPHAKVALLPTFYFEGADGKLVPTVDSTPIIRKLEADYAGRSVIPSDPVISFLDYLLEDYADEWLTKAMFHYRWYYQADIDYAGSVLPVYSSADPLSPQTLAAMKKSIADRQVSRLYVVGSNDTTAPVIEDSYKRYLDIMSRHFEKHRFTLGARPGACDFGAFGQLTQLVRFDPTPAAVAMKTAPRVGGWVDLMEDLSGIEVEDGDWISRDAIPDTLRDLLAEVGRVYVPALLANAKALMAGEKMVETVIDAKPWVQEAFPYQGKCLGWIREEYQKRSDADRRAIDAILAGTGCERLLAN